MNLHSYIFCYTEKNSTEVHCGENGQDLRGLEWTGMDWMLWDTASNTHRPNALFALYGRRTGMDELRGEVRRVDLSAEGDAREGESSEYAVALVVGKKVNRPEEGRGPKQDRMDRAECGEKKANGRSKKVVSGWQLQLGGRPATVGDWWACACCEACAGSDEDGAGHTCVSVGSGQMFEEVQAAERLRTEHGEEEWRGGVPVQSEEFGEVGRLGR
jgi:hypothetical protein